MSPTRFVLAILSLAVVLSGLAPVNAVAAPVVPVETGAEPSEDGYLSSGRDYSAVNDFDYAAASKTKAAVAALPAKYDLRTDGLPGAVGAVRDQGSEPTCWSFGITASARSSLIRNGATAVDISPRHLVSAYAWMNGSKEIPSAGYHEYGVQVWSKWYGAQPETAYPYSAKKKDWLVTSAAQITSSQYHLRSAVELPAAAANRDVVKRALLEKGVLSMEADRPSIWQVLLNPTGFVNNAWYGADSSSDHIVALVGWDDSYPAKKFGSGNHRPPGDGAWLIQNSWGKSSGDKGYYWVSYYDQAATTNATWYFDIVPAALDGYDHNYWVYRSSGSVMDVRSRFVANVFDAPANQQLLQAVTTWFSDPGTNYEIAVYKAPKGDVPDSGVQEDVGAGASWTTSGRQLYAGYYTIALDEPAILDPGVSYSVVVKQTTDSGHPARSMQVYSALDKSKSYSSDDGNTWTSGKGTNTWMMHALTTDLVGPACKGELKVTGLPATVGKQLGIETPVCQLRDVVIKWQGATSPTYTPTAADVGKTLNVSATVTKDGMSRTLTATVGPVAASDPVLSLSAQSLTVDRGENKTLPAKLNNQTGLQPVFTASTPAWMSIDPNTGTLQAAPTASTATGAHKVTVTATVGRLSSSATYTITATASGKRLSAAYPDESPAYVGMSKSLTAEVVNTTGNPITWISVDLPDYATFDAKTGAVKLEPARHEQLGRDYFVVAAAAGDYRTEIRKEFNLAVYLNYTVSQSDWNPGKASNSLTVTVTSSGSDGGWHILSDSALSSDADWLTAEFGTWTDKDDGTANGKLKLKVTKNTDSARVGHLTIANRLVITVNQAGKN
ncbi:MAG: lectin like domain-containing protein [Propionibacteriaceae bacterium]|jgi:C1A family cysteine protease|nr:lectin like domain-containing protein [Propionibacteriaceae bacterium]